MRILIVEDSPLARKMYGLVFPPRDHVLEAAENGRQGLSLLERPGAHFDLVLLDLRMPDMNGVEFIERVKRGGVLARVPIVLTTAESEDSEMMQRARALGVAAVVHKPWKPQDLRAVVQAVLAKEVP